MIEFKVTCDMCKRKLDDFEDPIKIVHQFGYGTEYDGERWEFEICEECLIKIVKENNINKRIFTFN